MQHAWLARRHETETPFGAFDKETDANPTLRMEGLYSFRVRLLAAHDRFGACGGRLDRVAVVPARGCVPVAVGAIAGRPGGGIFQGLMKRRVSDREVPLFPGGIPEPSGREPRFGRPIVGDL